jgi:hypothetical protein
MHFLDLSDDLLSSILQPRHPDTCSSHFLSISYHTFKTQCRLSRVCKRFYALAKELNIDENGWNRYISHRLHITHWIDFDFSKVEQLKTYDLDTLEWIYFPNLLKLANTHREVSSSHPLTLQRLQYSHTNKAWMVCLSQRKLDRQCGKKLDIKCPLPDLLVHGSRRNKPQERRFDWNGYMSAVTRSLMEPINRRITTLSITGTSCGTQAFRIIGECLLTSMITDLDISGHPKKEKDDFVPIFQNADQLVAFDLVIHIVDHYRQENGLLSSNTFKDQR